MSCLSSPKSRNTTFESVVRYFVIRLILLMLSELNVQYMNRSVCEFELPFIMLRTTIKKPRMTKIKKTDIKKSWFLQIILAVFVSIKVNIECNETTPVISFYRLHEDFNIFKKSTPNCHQKTKTASGSPWFVKLKRNQRQIWNQRPLKRWRPLWPFILRLF